MSLATDVRTYAEIALEQGKHFVDQAQGRLTNVRGEARDYASAAAEDAKHFAGSFAELARKQAFAVIGASDAAVAAVTKRVEELPNEARANTEKVVGTANRSIAKAGNSVGSVQERAQAFAANAKGLDPADGVKVAKTTVEGVLFQAKATFDALAQRGERLTAQLSRDPRVGRVVKLVDRTEDEVLAAAAKPARKRSAQKAQATKATARRSAAAKAAAKKPATKRTPAKASARTARSTSARTGAARKSTAAKTSARKAPAKRA